MSRGIALYPFIPSGADFALALRFFQELGFQKVWEDGGYADLKFDKATFLLQQIDVPEWQKNQMIVLEVDDLEAYWVEISRLDLPSRYPGVRLKEPTGYPWGREVHLIDPAGICWHVRQAG